jgi:FMN phosphatase YigB (HAD superfamily)
LKGLRLPPDQISWHASKGIQIARSGNIPETFGRKKIYGESLAPRQVVGTHIVAVRRGARQPLRAALAPSADREARWFMRAHARFAAAQDFAADPSLARGAAVTMLRAVSRRVEVRLVCFDLGGVLVRIRTQWADLCRAANLDVRGESGGDVAERARRRLSDALQLGELSPEAWTAELGAALGGLYTREEIAALHDAVLVEEYAGVRALIDDLHRAGVATACLSNTNAVHWATMLHLDGTEPLAGEPRYPAVRSLRSLNASHLMRLTKPALDMYRALERATGYSGAEILFFDDVAENVAAAREAGWCAERIDPAEPTDLQMRRHLAAYGVL